MRLPSLLIEYDAFTKTRNRLETTGILDLSNLEIFTPGIVLPIAITIEQKRITSYVPPKDKQWARFFEGIISGSNSGRSEPDQRWPLIELPKNKHQSGPQIDRLFELGGDIGGKNAFRYLVGELTDNIYDHSGFQHAMVMAQRQNEHKRLRLGFADDGMTIAGSLRNVGMEIEDDVEAIEMAVNGLSSKDENERGKGLGSNIKMITEGYGGEIIIVSGKGMIIYRFDAVRKKVNWEEYPLSTWRMFPGTLLSISVPMIKKEIDVYAFVSV